jgi:hypothetical protein
VDPIVAVVRVTPADTPSGWWVLAHFRVGHSQWDRGEVRLPTFALPSGLTRGTEVPLVYAGTRGYGMWRPDPRWLARERTGKEEAR